MHAGGPRVHVLPSTRFLCGGVLKPDRSGGHAACMLGVVDAVVEALSCGGVQAQWWSRGGGGGEVQAVLRQVDGIFGGGGGGERGVWL